MVVLVRTYDIIISSYEYNGTVNYYIYGVRDTFLLTSIDDISLVSARLEVK